MTRRFLTTITLVVTATLIFSFDTSRQIEETIITINADKPTKFDMFHNSKSVKSLKTPYEIKLQSSNDRFIFKSANGKTNLRIVVKKTSAELTARWPLTVLIIDRDEMTTFGMD